MKLVICGDLSVTDTSREIFKNADAVAAFGDTLPLYAGADRAIVNLECALTEKEPGIKKIGPCLKGPESTADTLKAAGFTDCALSNNHIMDYGPEGLKDTIAALDRCGIGHTGTGKNYEDSRRDLIFEKDGFRIAVVNVCEHEYNYATEDRPGARPFDEFETMSDIRRAAAVADRVIVIYHGGKEHCRYPSPRLRKACREMVHSGADAVLCQHSHCIGAYEEYNGAHILYGQGNFHFPKYIDTPAWGEGLIVSLDIDKEKSEIDFIPVKVADEGGIRLANDAEKDEILSEFRKRGESLKSGSWKDGWKSFCEEMRAQYEKAVDGFTCGGDAFGRELFAHYLDCEAHTDVWREIFKTTHGAGTV